MTDEPYLTITQLRARMASIYPGGKTPGYEAIRKAMNLGMPFDTDPIRNKPRFLWSKVEHWYRTGQTQ